MSKSSLKKIKLLLVEDEELIALAESEAIKGHGFDVVHVINGPQAIDYLQFHDDVALILMDIYLDAEMNGIEVATQIQNLIKPKSIPIIFLSSHTEPEIVKLTERVESFSYMLKNIETSVLVASINMALKMNQLIQKIQDQKDDLEEREKRYRIIAENSNDAVVIYSHSQIQFVNQNFIEMTEFDEYSLQMQKNEFFIEDFPNLFDYDKMMFEDNNSIKYESKIHTRSNKILDVDIKATKITIQDQTAIFLTFRDITEIKQLINTIEEFKSQEFPQDKEIFPMCASCKHIRFERPEISEEPSWISIETFLKPRLPKIRFSHTVCPDCVKKLYPELKKLGKSLHKS